MWIKSLVLLEIVDDLLIFYRFLKMDVTYWNKRATKGCIYRGERFYTISAVPYYWKRREFVVRKLKDIIIKNDYKMVCDIGCGDGEYIHKLLHTCHDVFFEGIDSSPEMIFAASDRMNEDSRVDSDRYHLNISSDGIKDDKNYDLIYICCVAAHLENSKVLSLVKNAYLHLNSGGAVRSYRANGPVLLFRERV